MPWFAFTDASNETFVFRLTDPARIAEARAILSGAETAAVRVAGTVVKEPAAANIGWSFHLDPASVFFFEISTEVGDSTMRLIENDLDAVGGAFLPGSVWTGWSSELTAELDAVFGNEDPNTLSGSAAADIIFARAGDDTASGGAGHDHLVGGQGADHLSGNQGDDKLDGNRGDDILRGGSGNDVLVASSGSDRLDGGDGADTYIIRGPDLLGRTLIAGFDPALKGERIHIDRAWLENLDDLTGDGRINAADLAASFTASGANLVFVFDADTRLVLKDLAGETLGAGDFFLL
jgi:Ca2+-binding RTX toxin-like protein